MKNTVLTNLHPMKNKIPRELLASLFSVALIVPAAQAAVFTSSSNTTGTYSWAAGTGWSAVPVSAADTTLVFSGVAFGAQTITSNNHIAGTFQLNRLDANVLTGSSTGNLVITGNTLEFINNGATTPTMVFRGAGTKLFQTNIILTNNTTITTTNGQNAHTFDTGIISGAGRLTNAGGDLRMFSQNTYSGGTIIDSGSIISVSASGGPGTGSGSLGTALITMNIRYT